MTVRELIAHLQTLPQDYLVAYQCCSDSAKLEAEEITVIHATDKRVIQHHNMPDMIRDYREWEHHKSGPIPHFIDVVMFPGN